MKTFKIWLEHAFTRDQNTKIQQIYDIAIKLLLGSARDQTHLSLSDIEDDSAESGKPPTQKGAMVALKKLNSAQVFQKIEKIGDVDLTQRSQEVQKWLTKVAQDQNVGPKDTVGELMNRLFGSDAIETYGKHTWQSKAQVEPQSPKNNFPPQQQPDPQMGQTPPDMGQQAPQMGQPPAQPGMTPDMMGGGPLQSPGGPMPPKPPMPF